MRYAKYKFAERSHNFLMQLPTQLIFGDCWDLDKFQTCAKGKFILEFCSVWKEIQNIQNIKTEQKKYQKMVWPSRPLKSICLFDQFDIHAKGKSSSEFRSPDKNPLRKIQIFGTESLLLNAITYAAHLWWPLRSWQASDLCQRKIHFGIPFRVKGNPKNAKN